MRRLASILFLGLVLVASCKKTESAEPVLTKCKSDAECVFVQKARGDCCVNPCGGTSKAVHQDEAAAISNYNASYCTEARRKECPQAGACGHETPVLSAPPKCTDGACIGGG